MAIYDLFLYDLWQYTNLFHLNQKCNVRRMVSNIRLEQISTAGAMATARRLAKEEGLLCSSHFFSHLNQGCNIRLRVTIYDLRVQYTTQNCNIRLFLASKAGVNRADHLGGRHGDGAPAGQGGGPPLRHLVGRRREGRHRGKTTRAYNSKTM